jgi:hypothetical protein
MKKRNLLALGLGGLIGVVGLSAYLAPVRLKSWSLEHAGDVLSSAVSRQTLSRGPAHEYFDALASRPDVLAAYSLRDAAEIEKHRRGRARAVEPGVTYDPAGDPDPRRQDAAKVVIRAGKGNLATQVWLPTNHAPRQNLFVTWDSWIGAEYAFESSGISNYKAWNLCSPGSSIWTEIRARLQLANNTPGVVAFTDIRQYNPGQQGPNVERGKRVGGRSYGGNSVGPLSNEFGVAPETWTRYWLYLEHHDDWYRLYLWVSDETRDAVQVYDGLQVAPRGNGRPARISMDGTWDIFRLEYNTSSNVVPEGRGELVAYARNVVMLKGLSRDGVQGLLQRPVR